MLLFILLCREGFQPLLQNSSWGRPSGLNKVPNTRSKEFVFGRDEFEEGVLLAEPCERFLKTSLEVLIQ